MRVGKKPCGSAAARVQVCVYVCACLCVCERCARECVRVYISQQIHLLLKSRQTHRRKAHTRRRLESSVVFGFSSLSHIFSFFSSLTGRDQCRPCSTYYYYYKHRYTYIYTPKHYHYYIIIFRRRRCTLQSALSCVCVFFPGLLNRAIINTGCTRSTAFSIRPAFRPTTLQRLFAFFLLSIYTGHSPAARV